MLDDVQLIGWLLANGGPIVRWRTANELQPDVPAGELAAYQHALLATPLVQQWLERLTLGDLAAPLEALDAPGLGRLGGLVHGGKTACLENVFGKLAEFGLRAGMPALDARALPLMRLFRWRSTFMDDLIYRRAWETLAKSVFAWGLLRLGYTPDEPMRAFLREHLSMCHMVACDRVYDLYADESELVGLPKAWVDKPILKQDVMAHYWLPYIHNLYVLAHLPPDLLDTEARGMIGDLLAYILDPRFQALREGYGYAWIKERRTCYGWGWSPHLPGYKGFDALPGSTVTPFLARVELLAHFPQGRQSAWLRQAIQHLEGYRTVQGTYRFPSVYLHEAEGYYVSGYGMGLGESRRKSVGVEVESTFRMLKIRALYQSDYTGGSR
jgi:hypothetical protein